MSKIKGARSALALIFLLAMIVPVQSSAGAQVETTADDQTNVAITIYNDGTGLVKDTRSLNLPDGQFDLIYMDVASAMDPTSVHFVSLTNPGALGVLEQNYEYDLVSTAALYQKNIDNHVLVRMDDGTTVDGILLAYDGNLVVKTAGGVMIINNPVQVSFDELPEGLITRPTLRWSLVNGSAGTHQTEMSYLTSGLGWSANYVAIVGQNDDVLDLSGWVTINNTSGADYTDAVLKLVAGQVHKVQPQYAVRAETMAMNGAAQAPVPGFQEESFFEYHLYTLQRPATVLNNQQKQISLLEGEGIKATKIFVFDPGYPYYYAGDTANADIAVRLKFMNSENNGLGIPIPKGVLRVYKKDSSGSLQFIGEDSIDHTPKDEEIEIYLGDAFDIVGERSVLDRRKIDDATWEYDVKVTVRNHKEEPVTITYWDHVWGDWEVRTSSHDYTQKDASTLEFLIPVAASGESAVTYTIRRQW
jgi:hypothetical protein